jgi:hypothetical protein
VHTHNVVVVNEYDFIMIIGNSSATLRSRFSQFLRSHQVQLDNFGKIRSSDKTKQMNAKLAATKKANFFLKE